MIELHLSKSIELRIFPGHVASNHPGKAGIRSTLDNEALTALATVCCLTCRIMVDSPRKSQRNRGSLYSQIKMQRHRIDDDSAICGMRKLMPPAGASGLRLVLWDQDAEPVIVSVEDS